MSNKIAELLLAQQRLKEAQQRVDILQMELEDSGEEYVVEWVDNGERHRTMFYSIDVAVNFWKDIAAIYCPTLYKVFV